MLGANPLASNGSLMTAPDVRGRLRAIRARGGKLVVVDPRRTRTAQAGRRAPRSSAPAPTPCCCSRWCTCCSPRAWPTRLRGEHVAGLDEVRALAEPFTPEAVRRSLRHRGRRRSAAWRASCARAPGAGRGLRAHRHDDADVRHGRELAGRRAQRAHRQPRPAGRRDVPEGRHRAARHAAASPAAAAA